MTDEDVDTSEQPDEPEKLADVSFAAFLTGVPPLESRTITAGPTEKRGGGAPQIRLPAIQIHCGYTTCNGTRYFDPAEREGIVVFASKLNVWNDIVIHYFCRNCRRTQKKFALSYRLESLNSKTTDMFKIGEYPAFGEPRPNLIKDVLEDEIEYFERGYRAETAGLGIGAFAYYRRFVESHKNKIIGEIRKVAAVQGATPKALETLDRALKTNSFEKAVETVKDAIPDGLRYHGGHNPLTLLHTALSIGLHSDDDVQCLELAKDIRFVLTDLAERTVLSLKNNDELGAAVKRLLQRSAKP